MSHIDIDPVTLVPSCSRCGMPIPKTVAEVVVAISRWPIICLCCKEGANEIRYDGSRKSVSVSTD